MKSIKAPQLNSIMDLVNKREGHIHVLVGPRQVGKTTTVKQLSENSGLVSKYISADGEVSRPKSWLSLQWQMSLGEGVELLIIDEIQKVENWAEEAKRFWDQRGESSPRLILLGSSSLSLHRGLSESLTGRYILHRVYHWDFESSQKLLNELDLKKYLEHGGYPGSYEFIENKFEWLSFVKDSIITPVIEKDILSMVHVKSPALFRQSFDLICSYASQEISYTKLLGQLQDKGNTDLVKNYIKLFEAAFLVKSLEKYSGKIIKKRSSSPKLYPLAPALYSQAIDMQFDEEYYGHAFELFILMELLKFPGSVYYWRERSYEVDFILEIGNKLIAVEVKYTSLPESTKGLEEFVTKFENVVPLIINKDNYRAKLKLISDLVFS